MQVRALGPATLSDARLLLQDYMKVHVDGILLKTSSTQKAKIILIALKRNILSDNEKHL